MEKRPLLAIDREGPLELWYEGPAYLVVLKPPGVPVHPATPEERGTLVNALFRDNRWLAEMEHSVAPGVVYRMRAQDHGMMALAVEEAEAERLRGLHAAGAWRFRYRLRLPPGEWPAAAEWTVNDRRAYDAAQVWDVETAVGDTDRLSAALPAPAAQESRWYCYRVEVPQPDGGRRVWELGRPVALPAIDLYTAPT